MHITLKLRREVATLRTKTKVKVLRSAIAACRERAGGRVIQWSIQRDHIHLICEAARRRALSRAMQGLSIRIAKGLNRLLGRKGSVFLDRYHAHIL
ncbi:MAG: transposase, partial [Myxococcota bacterium]